MSAKRGRGRYVADGGKGHIDPGARTIAYMIEILRQQLEAIINSSNDITECSTWIYLAIRAMADRCGRGINIGFELNLPA